MIYKHILGEINFIATGDNITKFINAIRKDKIIAKSIHTINNEVMGTIYATSYKKLVKIAKTNNMQVEFKNEKGLIHKIKPYRKRFGIILGIILSMIIILYLSNTVLVIKVTGCEGELYEKVMSLLNSNGVEAGKFIPDLNFDSIENELILNIKDVSWASIRSSGGIITVNIHEATPKPYMVPTRYPCNLISTKDAVVKSVEVYAGELMVLIGDGVKKGDLLVSGFVIDKKSKPLYFHSQAKIIGEYKETISITQPLNDEVQVVSDKKIDRRLLNFFSIRIPMYIGDEINGEYTFEEYTSYISFLTFKIPIGITHKIYKPYETIVKTYTAEEAEAEIRNKISIYEDNFLKNCKIIKKDETVDSDQENVSITIEYVLQGEITSESEILTKK